VTVAGDVHRLHPRRLRLDPEVDPSLDGTSSDAAFIVGVAMRDWPGAMARVRRECLEVAAATCRECHENPTVYELAEVFGALRALARVTARGQMESTATVMLEMARDAVSEIIRWLLAGRMDGAAPRS
jgi:hypothetical protein